MSRETLWKGFEGIGLYAQRANKDKKGNVIDETYETKANVTAGLAGKVDKVPGKGLSTEDYTTEEKTKLSGIESGAQVNIIESVKVDGTALSIDANKAVDIPLASATESGNETVYVTGVVSGQDKAKWDNWVSDEFPIIPKPNIVVIGGRAYPTVKIGNQMWMAENLDYKWTGLGDNLAKYYDNDESTYGVNGNKYGLLYAWDAAKSLNDNRDSLLPEGWHVPSSEELTTLINTVGSSDYRKLMSTTGWRTLNGTNETGFNAYPCGQGTPGGTSSFSELTTCTYFWSTSQANRNYGYHLYLSESAVGTWFRDKTNLYSLRLVKNLA